MEEPTCPRCPAEFDSWAKLRQHHVSIHGESLPNTECENCGEWFFSKYAKYCSDECREESVSFEGANNPMYQGAKETTECEICGDEFTYYPSEKPGKYCPICVKNENWRHRPESSGPANPRWDGGKVELTCAVCEKTFERYPSGIEGEVSLCSNDCQYEWLSEAFAGDGHPNWEGGDPGPYGPGWNRIRRAALQRDGHACVVCGKTSAEIGRNPDVHRKADIGEIPKDELRSLIGTESEPK